ncbi:MAG: hypothetical protein M0C28_42895 [Candidatus Moduliflexus flocculans]|nr:hypothetical protein [Candidatus Moduliflexus flocculans]
MAGDQFYGPKGSAALFVRKGVRILPLVDGGIQEGGRRGGTENVPAIAGLGAAARLAGAGHGRPRRRARPAPGPAPRGAAAADRARRRDRLPDRPPAPPRQPLRRVRRGRGHAALPGHERASPPRAARPAPPRRSRSRTSCWPWDSTTPSAQGSLVFSLIDGDDRRGHRHAPRGLPADRRQAADRCRRSTRRS